MSDTSPEVETAPVTAQAVIPPPPPPIEDRVREVTPVAFFDGNTRADAIAVDMDLRPGSHPIHPSENRTHTFDVSKETRETVHHQPAVAGGEPEPEPEPTPPPAPPTPPPAPAPAAPPPTAPSTAAAPVIPPTPPSPDMAGPAKGPGPASAPVQKAAARPATPPS
jgi:hypothetical protein